MTIRIAIEIGQAKTTRAQVYGMSYGLKMLTPRNLSYAIKLDVGTGQASGKRQYPPLIIRKEIDPSSPLLFTSLTGQVLPAVNLKFYRTDRSGSGSEENFYTIILSNAVITRNQRRILPMRDWRPQSIGQGDLEEVEFTFQKIEFGHETASTTAEDDWSKQA